MSVERVLLSAYDPNVRGTNPNFMKKVLARRRRPNRAMLEAIADVLSVPPTTFIEYRMLAIRDALDSDDFDGAVRTLEVIESALGGGHPAAELAADETTPDEGDFPLGPLKQLLEASQPTQESARPSPRRRAVGRRRRSA